ncbi:hypothetical protein JOC86_003103 [Bacillus pakistanensis]|uniref:Sporulation protein n=1 Tax=Rossellomorea pakistanensis TaxID=992288 RepID=A0ABS2NFC5_9BACI|nr:sporulation protein [Bacillus pakistanensis]MBM7586551.1 hypothetical protein [Bacillus pakistanensis]
MKKLVFTVPLLFLFSGCSNLEEPHDESRVALIKKTNPPPIELVDHPETDSVGHAIKKDVDKLEELYDTAVIQGMDKDVLVAYKVKHLQRFHMKKIEKKMKKKLEEKYPDMDFTVSSDYKIFLETIRLKERIESKHISNKEAEKRFKEIVDLQQELT